MFSPKWFREQFDCVFLSNNEWKKKYCPSVYDYFSSSDENRKIIYSKMADTLKDMSICKYCGKDFYPTVSIFSNVEIEEGWKEKAKHEEICDMRKENICEQIWS
uniref:Uncharacterized protein n=1 Tax=viral metagenome TaxID=1070528 RepID=A0A6H1ZY10_9ZZZZ